MARTPATPPLYRTLELAFRTQYAEVRERSLAAGPLLPGTPGTLALRQGTGYGYWYRRYNTLPNHEVEDLVGRQADAAAADAMRARIDFAAWMQRQVRDLRRLGLQVADKDVSRLLVELHNQGLFAAGLVLVGTLAYMAWLNELGAVATSPRTQDVDLARRQPLKLAAPLAFLDAVDATRLKFFPVPGLPNGVPSTSVKRPGADGLRVDMLVPGKRLGEILPLPELHWHAQAVPHYDHLLDGARDAVVLAGGHCIPVKLPAPERFVWHKLYSSTARVNDPTKADKDLLQAATLAAVLVERDDADFADAVRELPAALRAAARARLPRLRERWGAVHPEVLAQFEGVLGA